MCLRDVEPGAISNRGALFYSGYVTDGNGWVLLWTAAVVLAGNHRSVAQRASINMWTNCPPL